jgi:hypothetical protein
VRTSCCPSSRFLSILWTSKNFNFGQVSLHLTHCTASQTDIEPRHPGSDSTLEPFGFSSAAWYTTVIPEKWPRDATDTLTLSSLGRNWYAFLTAGRNLYVPLIITWLLFWTLSFALSFSIHSHTWPASIKCNEGKVPTQLELSKGASLNYWIPKEMQSTVNVLSIPIIVASASQALLATDGINPLLVDSLPFSGEFLHISSILISS